MGDKDVGNLTGSHFVRVFAPAWKDASRLLPRTKDRIELRAHALKLRYWPDKHPEDHNGQLLDLNWDWIRAMEGLRVGELRIDDTIGGQDNLRVIYDFTAAQITTFKGRRTLVNERFYKYREFR